MIDFKMAQADIASAAGLLTKARKSAKSDLVDLTCYRDNVKFVVTGREITLPAVVESTGAAQFPLSLMGKIGDLATTFKDEAPRIRIESSRIRVNSAAVTMKEIIVRKPTDRPIDIPDDAPVRDVLALPHLFTHQEVTASNLGKQVLAAMSAKLKAIDSAAQTLDQFGVPREAIEELVNEALKSHAETLRTMLKLEMQSTLPN